MHSGYRSICTVHGIRSSLHINPERLMVSWLCYGILSGLCYGFCLTGVCCCCSVASCCLTKIDSFLFRSGIECWVLLLLLFILSVVFVSFV